MSTVRACPDWPLLMEIAPDLQFKHYLAGELKLPADALIAAPDVDLNSAEVCCDVEHNVFYAAHTHPALGEALRGSHWFELQEWAARGAGP